MLAVLGAMPIETRLLLDQLTQRHELVRQGITLHRGLLHGRELLVATSGVGKVNAARVSTLLLAEGASALVFTGVAGALDPRLEPGDLVISSDCLQYDVDVSALGYEPGLIPGEQLCWAADERLQELALAAAAELPVTSFSGRVLSGDTFLADPARAAGLRQRFAGSCVEMEGAAVAQVCAAAGVPFVIIRSISDRADGGAKPDFRQFTELAARQSLKVVDGLLQRL